MADPIKLNPHRVLIKAPRDLVFQKMSHFGRGRMKGDNNESARVICRDGDKLVAEFVTKSWIFRYKTIEEVSIEAPNRITFTHLVGPLHYAWEEFVFNDIDGDTELVHNGEFIWSKFPLFGWLGGRLYTKRAFESVIGKHLEQVKITCEERGARSHVFRKKPEEQSTVDVVED